MWEVYVMFFPSGRMDLVERKYIVSKRRAEVSYEAINAVVAEFFPENDGTKIKKTWVIDLPDVVRGEVYS